MTGPLLFYLWITSTVFYFSAKITRSFMKT